MLSKSKTGTALLAIYTFWLGIASVAFVDAHGGISGDFEAVETRLDAHPLDRYAGCLLFNRWTTCDGDDPYIYELFTAVHVPALVMGQLCFKVLSLIPEFASPFPLGLSYPSYVFLLTIAIGAAQWYLLGILFEWLYRRMRPSVAAV
jgi:hypothetical protein